MNGGSEPLGFGIDQTVAVDIDGDDGVGAQNVSNDVVARHGPCEFTSAPRARVVTTKLDRNQAQLIRVFTAVVEQQKFAGYRIGGCWRITGRQTTRRRHIFVRIVDLQQSGVVLLRNRGRRRQTPGRGDPGRQRNGRIQRNGLNRSGQLRHRSTVESRQSCGQFLVGTDVLVGLAGFGALNQARLGGGH